MDQLNTTVRRRTYALGATNNNTQINFPIEFPGNGTVAGLNDVWGVKIEKIRLNVNGSPTLIGIPGFDQGEQMEFLFEGGIGRDNLEFDTDDSIIPSAERTLEIRSADKAFLFYGDVHDDTFVNDTTVAILRYELTTDKTFTQGDWISTLATMYCQGNIKGTLNPNTFQTLEIDFLLVIYWRWVKVPAFNAFAAHLGA